MNTKPTPDYLFHHNIWLLLMCAVITYSLSACSLFDGKNSDPDFNESLKKWQENNLSNYIFTLDRYCFCGGGPYPAKVVVKADTIFSVLDPDSQEPVSIDSTLTYTDIYPTIDDLFDLIQDAKDRDADRLDVRYDDRYGFPLDIDIDYSKEMVDEEMRYEITSFSGSSLPYPI